MLIIDFAKRKDISIYLTICAILGLILGFLVGYNVRKPSPVSAAEYEMKATILHKQREVRAEHEYRADLDTEAPERAEKSAKQNVKHFTNKKWDN